MNTCRSSAGNLARQVKDPLAEANVLNNLGIFTEDYTRKRDYYEQALKTL
jgi:hypothetical protein